MTAITRTENEATALDDAIERLERRHGLEVRPGEEPAHRRIVVASPKGGVGRTTVATNLAVLLAQRGGGDVALADLSLAFGDVGTALLLDPRTGLAGLAHEPRPFRTAAVSAAMTQHDSGVYVLCAPEDPVTAELFSSDDVADLVDCLTATHRRLVVDTPAGLDATTLAAVERATDLVLVSSLEVPAILGLRQAVDLLDRLGMKARRHLVVNRGTARTGVEAAEVASTLGLGVGVVIPESPLLPVATNEGRPVVATSPRSPAAKAMRQLADLIDGTDATPRSSSLRLRRGRRR